MNTVTITSAEVRVEPQGLDKLWTFHRRLDVPLAHVRGATYDPGATREPKGVRSKGLHWPGKTAGTFRHDGETVFWNVSDPRGTVAIELTGERYARLVLTVTDPRGLVDRINAAIGAASA